MMTRYGTLMAAALLTLCFAVPAFAQGGGQAEVARTLGQKKRQAIRQLKATIDHSRATERARLGKAHDGYLTHFGAPPGAPALLSPGLQNRDPETQAKGFLREHGQAFGITSPNVDFETRRVHTEGDRTYVRMRQTYAGLRVFAAETIVQLNGANGVYSVFNDFMRDASLFDDGTVSLTPTISEQEAAQYALVDRDVTLEGIFTSRRARLELIRESGSASPEEIAAAEAAMVTATLELEGAPELLILAPDVIGDMGDPALTWMVTVESSLPGVLHEEVFVDAHTGEVLSTHTLIHDARNREIWDRFWQPKWWLLPFPLLRRAEGDPIVTILDTIFYNAFNLNYDGFGQAWNYYYNFHGWDSWDGQGALIKSHMYYDLAMTQGAFHSGGEFYFKNIGAEIADDIIGHEFTHAVTRSTSDLVYKNESGAINESMSDIFGELIDLNTGGYYADPASKDWLIAEDYLFGAVRDMEDPKNPPNGLPSPSYYKGSYWEARTDTPNESNDMGGVHTNSGVGDHLFYLMVEGDTHDVSGITVPPFNANRDLSMDRGAELYWHCQTNLLTRASDYRHLCQALRQGGIDLGFSEAERNTIDQGCRAVGIAPYPHFTIQDSTGQGLVLFKDTGDVIILHGQLHERRANLSQYENYDKFVVQTTTEIVAVVKSLSNRGLPDDMYILQDLYENQTNLDTYSNNGQSDFIVQMNIGTPSAPQMRVLAVIDAQGNLRLRGKLYDDTLPY